MQKGSSLDVRKVARERRKIRTDPKIFLGNIASLIRDFYRIMKDFHIIKERIFSQEKERLNNLIRQPENFPQRGKSPYSSARSPLQGTTPARLRMASVLDCSTVRVSGFNKFCQEGGHED
jgi:hypothetical protein